MSAEMPDDGSPWLQVLIQRVDWHAVLDDISSAADSVNATKASAIAWIISQITEAIDFIHTMTVPDILYGIAAILIVAAYISRNTRTRIDYRNERRRREF